MKREKEREREREDEEEHNLVSGKLRSSTISSHKAYNNRDKTDRQKP